MQIMRHSPVNRRGGKTAVETTGGNANTFSAVKQRFLNIVAHCGLNGLSILRTLLLTVHNLDFLYSFTCFSVLQSNMHSLFLLSNTSLLCHGLRLKACCCTKFCLFIQKNSPNTPLSSSKALGSKALTSLFSTKQVQSCPEL